jgi:hypothetical protein
LPSDFCAVDAIFASNQISALSDKGELAFSRPDSGELTLNWISSFPIPSAQPISFLSVSGGTVAFVKGKPRPRVFVTGGSLVEMVTFLSAANDTFILSDSQNAYFTAQVYSISELPAVIALSESTSSIQATTAEAAFRCEVHP